MCPPARGWATRLRVAHMKSDVGVTRQTLNNVVNGKSGISPEMAIRLSKTFGSTPDTWLRMQLAYDLAQARKDESKIKVRRQRVPQELHAH
ncbi:MAG: HigA family addiction module antitoxin [Terriglobia bacterium]